ncbi:MAG TPA: RNA polymerase sigma-70 factor [Ktedonobacteraceae bacterium]|nr:RNA polymerase sigma-70 factor [Ktedonobacteraceae bacterium]
MVESFESYRSYLFAIAYRMLGSAMDAEDMVQETYLRYQRTQPETISSLKAYLTTIITRLCMDQLQLARRKRELYVGPWLPEPILTRTTTEVADPQERVDMEESISLAFLLLLERLQPVERAVFLLREVFEYEFAEIAGILGKSEAACRRSFSRAKQHLSQHRPRFPSSPQAHRQLLTSYMQAVQTGEMGALEHMLAEDVTLWADSGGKVKQAALRPITGRDAVARFSMGTRRFLPQDYQVEIAVVNGQPATVFRANGKAFLVLAIEIEAGRIQTVRLMANPEKLPHI